MREILLEACAASHQMNRLILDHLDPGAWRAQPAGGRTIAEIFAHLHNNRLVWLERSAPHIRRPARVDPARCTVARAAAAHNRSAAACLQMLEGALSEDARRRVTTFSRGSWAPDWPAGATMGMYMFAHEAHHRGQVLMLAAQLGYPLPEAAEYGIWKWEKIWKQLGFPGPR